MTRPCVPSGAVPAIHSRPGGCFKHKASGGPRPVVLENTGNNVIHRPFRKTGACKDIRHAQ